MLSEGADLAQLEAKLPGFFEKYLRPEMGDNINYRLELQPLTSIHLHSKLDYDTGTKGDIRYVYIFSAVALLILLIACINYMNLATASSSVRVREVGVRKVIGSQHSQLVTQFLMESMLLTAIAVFIGILLTDVVLSSFPGFFGKQLSMWHFGVVPTLGILLVFTGFVGGISGSYPAFFLSAFRPVLALKGQPGPQSGSIWLRKSLVVFQFVVSMVLIASAGIVYHQMQYVSNKNLGFNKDQVLTVHVQEQQVREQTAAIARQLLQNPLITHVAAASNPIGNNNIGSKGFFFEKDGQMATSTQIAQRFMVDAGFLATLQIPLVAGRNFSEDRLNDRQESVLVNETLVKSLGWQEPLGKWVQYAIRGDTLAEARVIGVVKDFHIYSLQHKIEPLVLQMAPPQERDNLYIRIHPENTREALAYIQNVYQSFDPNNPYEAHFLDQNFARQYETEQTHAQVLLVFTMLTISIACLGLFGLSAFAAEQRTKEIGIRKVLGASVQNIVLLLSKDFIRLVLIAFIISTPIAWYAMSGWLQDFAYRIDISLWVFAMAGGGALLIALLTVSYQSVKAALANPVKSLRSE
jgi:putative ABC transport system permease protein